MKSAAEIPIGNFRSSTKNFRRVGQKFTLEFGNVMHSEKFKIDFEEIFDRF
jgi:hypothetical protein